MSLSEFIENNNIQQVELLLQNGANVNDLTELHLHEACYLGYYEIVQLLIRYQADVNLKDETCYSPLYCACYKGHYEIVKLLIQNGADINSKDIYKISCEIGNHQLMKLLYETGAYLNTKDKENGNLPLHYACINGNLEIIKFLIEKGANVNEQNKTKRTPLHLAISYKDNKKNTKRLQTVELLLNNNANANLPDYDNLLPLHLACYNNYIDIIELLLLRNNGNVNAQSYFGSTPLHKLIIHHRNDLHSKIIPSILLLLRYGADINYKDIWDSTVLHYASSSDNSELVACLLEHNADVNAKKIYGLTPLMNACCEPSFDMNNRIKIVQNLLKYGADINIVNDANQSALYFALTNGHSEIVKILLLNGFPYVITPFKEQI